MGNNDINDTLHPEDYKCLTVYRGYPLETAQQEILGILKEIPSPQQFLQHIDDLYAEGKYPYSNSSYGFLYQFTDKVDYFSGNKTVSNEDKIRILKVIARLDKVSLKKFMDLVYRNYDGNMQHILLMLQHMDEETIPKWIDTILSIGNYDNEHRYNPYLLDLLDPDGRIGINFYNNPRSKLGYYGALANFNHTILDVDQKDIIDFIDRLDPVLFHEIMKLEDKARITNIIKIISSLSYEDAKIMLGYFKFRSQYLRYISSLTLESGLSLCNNVIETKRELGTHRANWILHYLGGKGSSHAEKLFTPENLDAAIKEWEKNNRRSWSNNDTSSHSG